MINLKTYHIKNFIFFLFCVSISNLTATQNNGYVINSKLNKKIILKGEVLVLYLTIKNIRPKSILNFDVNNSRIILRDKSGLVLNKDKITRHIYAGGYRYDMLNYIMSNDSGRYQCKYNETIKIEILLNKWVSTYKQGNYDVIIKPYIGEFVRMKKYNLISRWPGKTKEIKHRIKIVAPIYDRVIAELQEYERELRKKDNHKTIMKILYSSYPQAIIYQAKIAKNEFRNIHLNVRYQIFAIYLLKRNLRYHEEALRQLVAICKKEKVEPKVKLYAIKTIYDIWNTDKKNQRVTRITSDFRKKYAESITLADLYKSISNDATKKQKKTRDERKKSYSVLYSKNKIFKKLVSEKKRIIKRINKSESRKEINELLKKLKELDNKINNLTERHMNEKKKLNGDIKIQSPKSER